MIKILFSDGLTSQEYIDRKLPITISKSLSLAECNMATSYECAGLPMN